MQSSQFRWRSLLGLSVILFIIYGLFNVWAAVMVPYTMHTQGSTAMGGNIVSNAADGKVLGIDMTHLRDTNRRLDDFLIAYMDTMCMMMMNFAILQLAVAWFGLRRGYWWALWSLAVADLSFIPYFFSFAGIYAKYGVPLSEVVASFGYFWIIATAVLVIATISGYLGLRKLSVASA